MVGKPNYDIFLKTVRGLGITRSDTLDNNIEVL